MKNIQNENREHCKAIKILLEAIAEGHYLDEDGNAVTLYDYLNNQVLDYDVRVDNKHAYKSARLFVTLGGPNIWIDTEDALVHLAWGTERAEYPIDQDTRDMLDELMQEFLRTKKEVSAMNKREYCETHESIAFYFGLDGIEIKGIEYGINDYVYAISGCLSADDSAKQYHRCKLYDNDDKPYIRLYNQRIPMDEFMQYGGRICYKSEQTGKILHKEEKPKHVKNIKEA